MSNQTLQPISRSQLIFVVDDDPTIRKLLATILKKEGFSVTEFECGEDCLKHMEQNPVAVCLDLSMPGMGGIGTLTAIKQESPDTIVIMITSSNETDTVIDAIKLGAWDYIVKPPDAKRLKISIAKAIQHSSLKHDNLILKEEIKTLRKQSLIAGNSVAIKTLRHSIEKVKDTNAHVLIIGESGTGKELVARSIHQDSIYQDGPLLEVNCGAIPESLQESELFGYRKGAFTGATESRKGKLELADGGTLFLDEIAEMNLKTQAAMLRFVQEKTFMALGSNSVTQVSVRIVAATNKDLKSEVAHGRFREDLYYRLSVFPIYIPPLRDRKEDIPLLSAIFMEKYGQELNKLMRSISPEAMNALMAYNWPGNVRELQNIIYRAMIVADSNTISTDCLSLEILNYNPINSGHSKIPAPSDISQYVSGSLSSLKREAIQNALETSKGQVSQAAKILGVSRSNLYRLIKKYNLA